MDHVTNTYPTFQSLVASATRSQATLANIRRLLLSICTFILASGSAFAVSLAWDPSPDSSVTGYVVHIGTTAGLYTTTVDVGGATSYALPAVAEGTTRYFAVTAYNAAGSESSYSNEISYTEPYKAPVAAFSASVTSGTAPLALNFTSASTGSITSYLWTFGDGTTSSSQSPAKVYSSAGVYTVSLQVTGPGGTNTQTRTNYITATGTVDTTPPGVPPSAGATTVSTSSIKVTWSAATDDVGVVSYRLERCQGTTCTNFAQVATVTSTSYLDSALLSGTTYRYRIRAADAAGNLGGYSAVVAATTSSNTTDTTAPSSPGTPVAVPSGSTSVNLSWSASTDNVGVTGYRLERCRGRHCRYFVAIAAPSGTSYADTGLTAGTTYRYRVRAIDAAGNFSKYSSTTSVTTAGSGAVTGFAPVN